MSNVSETVMKERCAGCAFRPNTDASTSEWTRWLAKLCVDTGVAFNCHGEGEPHLCRGFVDAFTVKVANGDYDRLPEWKNQVMRNLIDVLEDYRDASLRGEAASFDVEDAVRKAAIIEEGAMTQRESQDKSMNINQAASIMGRKGGKKKSHAKASASRQNGKCGGRPKKK